MKAYQAIGATLRDLGCEMLFGLLGDGNIRVAVAAQANGIPYLGGRHEHAAVAMADGYSRLSGRVGWSTVTTGPGVTNTFTALGESVRARVPIVLLAGAAATTDAYHLQTIDQDGMAKALGCGVQRFRSAELLPTDLETAHRRALAERRPILFSIPTDAQDAEIGDFPAVQPTAISAAVTPGRAAVDEIVGLIAHSRRPVILAGWGAARAHAESDLRRLGDRIGALLVTSATAKGLFAGDPYWIGTSGGFSSDGAAEELVRADLVLSFGASLNKWTTRSGSLFPDAAVVQVDDEASAFGFYFRNTYPVLGDAAATASLLLEALDDRVAPGYRSEVSPARALELRDGDEFVDAGDGTTIDPRTLTLWLRENLPADSVIVNDSGAFMGFPGSYFEPRMPRRYLFPQAFQSVGLGIAQTIGAGVATPSALRVTLIGDGGTYMSLGELETVVRAGAPHLVVVYNDSAYGAEIHVGAHHHFDPALVQFPDSDFAAIAASVGGAGVTVRATAGLSALESWLRNPSGLFMVDAKVDSSIPAPLWREFFRAPADAPRAAGPLPSSDGKS